jgi:hypothetical protein
LVHGIITSALVLACENEDPSGGVPSPSTRDSSGDGSEGPYAFKTTISLGSTSLAPGEVVDVGIQIDPPRSRDVRVAITSGSELGFLNDSVLLTDSNGYTRTKLTVARTGVGKLTLQALVDGAAAAYLDAYVESPEEATLKVVPVYAGDRPFAEWHVAILDAPTCPTSYGSYVDQEGQTFSRLPEGEPLLVDAVPSGQPVSVLVRAEQYAFGCAPAVIITNDMRQVVEIVVTDSPLVVSNLDLPLRFGVYPNSEPFWGDLTNYLATLGDAFRGEFAADSVALLSRMEALASSPEAFEARRAAKSWDNLLEVRLSAAGASQGLTSRVQRWLQEGARLLQSNSALRARIEAPDAKSAAVELSTLAGLVPADVGIAQSRVQATLTTSGTDDVVRLAFTLQFEPSRLFGALAAEAMARPQTFDSCIPVDAEPSTSEDAGVADAQTQDAAPTLASDADYAVDASWSDAGITDPPAALAALVGCSSVGAWLSEDTGYAYDDCDATCTAALCEDAIAHLWQQVLDADTDEKTLQVSAAGRAELDERARVTSLATGEWIGTTDLFQTEPKGTLQGCTGSLSP